MAGVGAPPTSRYQTRPIDVQVREALSSKNPGQAMEQVVLANPGLFPELAALKKINDGSAHKDNWWHTWKVADQTMLTSDGDETEDRITAAAAVWHDAGKPPKRQVKGKLVTFHGHETESSRIILRQLPKRGFTVAEADTISQVVLVSSRIQEIGQRDVNDSAIRRILTMVEGRPDVLRMAFRLARADVTSKKTSVQREVAENASHTHREMVRVAREDKEAKRRPPIDANRVMELTGLPPGPELGRVVKTMSKEALSRDTGNLMTVEEAERFVARYTDTPTSDGSSEVR